MLLLGGVSRNGTNLRAYFVVQSWRRVRAWLSFFAIVELVVLAYSAFAYRVFGGLYVASVAALACCTLVIKMVLRFLG
jgi:hypothetical protein